MREFDAKIEAWKKQAMTELGGDAKRVEELECHLRQSLEEISPGQSPEQAWQEAIHRLGSLAELKQEFAKLPAFGARDALFAWGFMLLTILVLAGFYIPALAKLRLQELPNAHEMKFERAVVSTLALLASMGTGILGGYFGVRIHFGSWNNRTLKTILPAAIIPMNWVAGILWLGYIAMSIFWRSGNEPPKSYYFGIAVALLMAALFLTFAIQYHLGRRSRQELLAKNGAVVPLIFSLMLGVITVAIDRWSMVACIILLVCLWECSYSASGFHGQQYKKSELTQRLPNESVVQNCTR